jgi:hypothetical protein
MAPSYVKIDLRIGLRNDPLTEVGGLSVNILAIER